MSQDTKPYYRFHIPPHFPTGVELLRAPLLNKGTAFSQQERQALRLQGLLPPRQLDIQAHAARVVQTLRRKPNDLEKYIYLIALEDRNETLFYRVVIDNLEEMMPLIYTPTVGLACQEYGHIFRRPRGLFISADDRGHVLEILNNWPFNDVRVIVVTDGERILGLGDLGVQGMGIPVGKASLYTACGGIDPSATLPIALDVGTNNQALLDDPMYIGLLQPRLRGQMYDDLIAEFVAAVQTRFPRALIQFEDFGNSNAFRILQAYRDMVCTFNDDIQGTAAVTLAGLYSALRIAGGQLRDQQVLFLGAGEAGVGIADLVATAMAEEGLSLDEARRHCWLVDSHGLVVKSRTGLAPHKLPYAHDFEFVPDLLTAIERLRPTALIGVSGQPQTFTQPMVELMTRLNARPIIFALSNPTSKAECTAEQAYTWSDGQAIYASGSPFKPVVYQGRTFVPGQGNNAYIFPGVGLGVVVSGARHVTDEMFMAAAKKLAQLVSDDDLAQGRIYPALNLIRMVSAEIGAAVAEVAYARGLADVPRPADLLAHVRASMYDPNYKVYVE